MPKEGYITKADKENIREHWGAIIKILYKYEWYTKPAKETTSAARLKIAANAFARWARLLNVIDE